jgi:hypothetical protein
MIKGKVIFEDEEKVEIKYPCFELKDVVEYYFEICTPNNSISPFSLVALPNVRFDKCPLLSPILDTERLIQNMMKWSNISEEELNNHLHRRWI